MNHCSASLLTNTFAAARLHNDSPPKVQTTGSNKPKLTEESLRNFYLLHKYDFSQGKFANVGFFCNFTWRNTACIVQ